MGQEAKIDLDQVLDYNWIYSSEIRKAEVKGDSLLGLCPFHEDSKPSLSVDLKTGMFHCFACGAEGNYTSFVAKKYGLSTKEAYKKILEDNHLDAGQRSVSKVASQQVYSVAEYALEKRLSDAWLKSECRMESARDKTGPYLKIPYMDEHGDEKTFRKRYPKGARKRFAWKYGGGGVPCLYGMWRIEKIREAGYVILVEGESDAQTLWSMELPALGVPGATTFQSQWCDSLKGLTVYLHLEPDKGGEAFHQTMLRKLQDGGFEGTVKTVSVGPLGVKDPSELWCRDGDEAKARILNLLEGAQEANLQQQVIAQMVEGAPVALRQPEGWLFGEDGIYMVDEDGLTTNVCATPVMISRRLRSRDTGLERVEVSFKRDGAWQSVTIGRSELFTSRGIVKLADNGIMVNSENAKYLVRYLDALEKNNLDTIEKVESTEQTGWQSGGRFMPFFADGLVFDSQNASHLENLCRNGTLEDWVATMGPHRERWRFRFILASAFAAPLLSILKCRIFCVYNWGNSRAGKTAALKAALSVWGDPDGLMCTYNGTDNAIEAYCAVFNDLPVGIDERQISGANDKSLSSLIYKLCEGTGRKRLNKDSSLRAVKTWRNVFLTTGEEPIISDRTMTGVSSRILEIEGGPFETEQDAAQMHRLCGENCGWAGPAFLETIRDDAARKAVKEMYATFNGWLENNANGANASHVACVAAVGVADILIGKQFFGEEHSEAVQRAGAMCQQLLKSVVENQPGDVNVSAVNYLGDWIEVHRQNFGNEVKGPVYGFFDEECVYLVPSIFTQALEEGRYSARKVRKHMAEKGYLKYSIEHGGKRVYTVVRRHKGKSSRYVAILLSKLYDGGSGNALEFSDLDGQEVIPF